MEDEKEYMIKIKGSYKRYGKKAVVLRGLDISVEKGIIYGLLGPSGCGKTTLLSCVAGHLSLDAGTISVDLDSKRQLGYMPQDIALMDLFTVSEMFQYFGKINGLSSSKVKGKGHELLELMELPPGEFWKRVINTLSGGQQRRVSLTIALLHDPLLLILDEPTVGLDPVLSDKLWNFFVEITEKEGKTLVITTHYIEEARQAHMIGLMRNGVLLAEASPSKLLEEHKCDTLEEVFLFLSNKQFIESADNIAQVYPRKSSIKPAYSRSGLWDRNRLAAQIYKNICWIKRNIPIMLFMLLLPTLLMYLFCTVYSDYLSGLSIAVVTEEMWPDSCQHPGNHTGINLKCKPGSKLSCRFLPILEEKSGYNMEEYKDFDSGKQSVVDGNTRALLHFHRNYSWALIRRLSENFLTPDRYVNASMMNVYIDMAEMTIGLKIERDIRDSFEEFIQLVFKDCNYNLRAAASVLQFEQPIFGDRSPKFADTAMPGFIIPFAFYFTTVFSSSAVISEKNSGFLQRCLIAGVHHTEIVFAHAVIQILMVIGQNLLLLTIAYGVYEMPLKGSWGLVLTFIALTEIQGMFYGFSLGTISEEERNVSFTAVGTVICLFITCGMFWPLEGAHWLLQSLMRYCPIIMTVESYRSVTLRGWGFDHSYITLSVLANIGVIILFIIIFVIISRCKYA